MTLGYKINPLIEKKLQAIKDKQLQDFIREILYEELKNLNLGERRYAKKYTDIIANYVKIGNSD
jgi:hypothetical protein